MNGIFIAAGPDIQRCAIDKVCIYDIAPTILYLFEQRIPPNIDGQVFEDIITAEYLANHPVKLQTKSQDYKYTAESVAVKGLTAKDEDNIQQQLKDLGYM